MRQAVSQPRKRRLDNFGSDTKVSKNDNFPDPDILAQEVVEDLEAALGNRYRVGVAGHARQTASRIQNPSSPCFVKPTFGS